MIPELTLNTPVSVSEENVTEGTEFVPSGNVPPAFKYSAAAKITPKKASPEAGAELKTIFVPDNLNPDEPEESGS